MKSLSQTRAIFSKTVLILILFYFFFSCKNASTEMSESAATKKYENNSAVADTSENDASSTRQFIKTTSMKFRVDNVQKTTDIIEKTVTKAGGFVSKMQLESNVLDKTSTKISLDSLVETTKFLVSNDISIRIPNKYLDRAIDTIAKQIKFLDSKNISQDDVTLQLLANTLEQKRDENYAKRLSKAIDEKGKNLTKIVDAEKNMAENNLAKDDARIDNLNLDDQVNFSTMSLNIYQNESILQEKILDVKSAASFKPNFGLQIIESIQTGWNVLGSIITFLFSLWSVFLIIFIGFFCYKNRHKILINK